MGFPLMCFRRHLHTPSSSTDLHKFLNFDISEKVSSVYYKKIVQMFVRCVSEGVERPYWILDQVQNLMA